MDDQLWTISVAIFPHSFLAERPPFRPFLYPNHSTRKTLYMFFSMCRTVHANAHSLPSVVYWAWQSQWARSSHPLDKAETELDCLRTVDTCIRRTMILNCLSLPLNGGTNKTLRASNAVAVGVNRDRALPSIITICCCSLSRVAVGARN